MRRYAKNTYCAPFEQKGWVYDDGALSIAAQTWLDNGEECETEVAVTGAEESDRGPTQTIPCLQTNSIDCAFLHHVRQTEVMAYIAERQRDGDVHCDDGTPLEELGVP